MIMKFDPYGAMMINHGNHILIVLHLYCCSKHIVYDANSVCCEPCAICHINILIQNIIQVFSVVYLFILYMIWIGYDLKSATKLLRPILLFPFSLQLPAWGQKKVAVVERLKQESMYGLSVKKNSWCRKVAFVERWPL